MERVMPPLISIVIPALNERGNIKDLERELAESLDSLPYEFEYIVVDNGSSDGTDEAVKEICRRDPRWKYVGLSRNFGIDASITAGYRLASGEAMVVLYSDLQDPPQVIPAFLEKWREGYDVVYGVRTVRPGDARWRNAAINLVYRLIAALADVDIPRNAGDFRLISRRVRDALNTCSEYNRYMRGLIAWLGFRQTGVEYKRRPRATGESKFPLGSLIAFALNAFTSFSIKPLRLFTVLGFVLVGLSLLAVPIYIYLYLTEGAPQGITTLIVLGLLGIGINSLGIGVLGEYLGRTYAETKRRPLYVIADSLNVTAEIMPVSGVAASPDRSAKDLIEGRFGPPSAET
jgi:glycosyltransferase involved in cell wall biosynthesis